MHCKGICAVKKVLKLREKEMVSICRIQTGHLPLARTLCLGWGWCMALWAWWGQNWNHQFAYARMSILCALCSCLCLWMLLNHCMVFSFHRRDRCWLISLTVFSSTQLDSVSCYYARHLLFLPTQAWHGSYARQVVFIAFLSFVVFLSIKIPLPWQ